MLALYGAEIELGGRLTDYQTVEADREGAVRHLGRALAGECVVVSAFSGEEAHRRFYDLVHVPLVKDGEVVGVVVRTHDVTERTLAEQALRENERALSTLLDNVPDVVFHVDREYRLVTANAAFSEAVAAAGGSPIVPGDPILPPDYADESGALWRDAYDRALGGESFVMETSVPSADGTRTMEKPDGRAPLPVPDRPARAGAWSPREMRRCARSSCRTSSATPGSSAPARRRR